ncbi:MAG: long-chain fatty acid transporter [Panacagrimonas sp.]|jgi:long-chain fatty acid transport protein|nr:long-chain fatty acid transporter [Panacagrimonas sp.]
MVIRCGRRLSRALAFCVSAVAALVAAGSAHAGGGYFILGYGPYAHQTSGTVTATGMDTFVGSSNPGKLNAVGDRLDLGMLMFHPYRKVSRTGAQGDAEIFNFSSTSENEFYLLPDGGYARRINDRWAWGVTLYGNGGLNTEYNGDTGIPNTNSNPGSTRCRNQNPGNFFGGCGEIGFDLAQVIVAPTLSYRLTDRHSFGISPQFGFQQFKAYGFQGFEPLSKHPGNVTNNGYERSFGAGVRVGWFGQLTPWLDAGASYATKIYFEPFDEYRGLLADGGRFDIPANFAVGIALKDDNVTLALEVHRIFFGNIPSLANGVTDTLTDPVNSGFGDRNGSGFNWRNQTNYRASLTWHATPRLDLRTGFTYGRRPNADGQVDTASFNMFTPNPQLNLNAGFSWRWRPDTELHLAYGRYTRAEYEGPSAVFPGATEKVQPHVDTLYMAWSLLW